MKAPAAKLIILIPVYNGSYFNSLLKLAEELKLHSNIDAVFLFGRAYPGQDRQISLLEGRFSHYIKYNVSKFSLGNSRVLNFLRTFPIVDESLEFIDTALKIFDLRIFLNGLFEREKIKACIFPADNRYFYPYIAKLARANKIPVLVAPQWFAGPKEIEESLFHSNIYRPNMLERLVIRFVSPKFIREVQHADTHFLMIPIRFSEILILALFRCVPPDPWVLHSGFVDRILVETPGCLNFALNLGFEEKQLSLTGSVYLDEMLSSKLNSGEDIRLLVAIAPDMFASRQHSDLEFDSYESYLRQLCEKLISLGYRDAVFSMHPSDVGHFDDLITRFGFEISKDPIHLLISRSQVFLATISATIQWANFLHVPTVNFDFYRYNYPDYDEYSFVYPIIRLRDLDAALIKAYVALNDFERKQLMERTLHHCHEKTSIQKIDSEINLLVSKGS